MKNVHAPEVVEELKKICQPIIDFLYLSGNPHTTILITQTKIELVQAEIGIPIEP